MILTGATAGLYYGTLKVGKVRNIDLDISREALRTTTLDSFDHTYIAGIRDTKASATLFYDPLDAAVVNIINALYADTSTSTTNFQFLWDSNTKRELTSAAVITNIGLSVAFGEAQVCKLSLQLSGKPISKFF
jgi:hypothetical protein